MNPLTLEWIEKAEGDFNTARRELRVRNQPNYDAVCFHSQQATEKYLKGFMQENGLPIPYIHNLVDLLTICTKADSSMALLEADLKSLNVYSVRYRYPGQTASKSEAVLALKSASFVRQHIHMKLGL